MGHSFPVVSPATGETLRVVQGHDDAAVEARLAGATCAQHAWARVPPWERAALMRRAADLLRARKDELAVLMANEMGKPLREGRAEAEKCAWAADYYAEHAHAMLARAPEETEATESFVAFRPLGVVLAVMPWNFPLWQVVRFAAPALMAGNAGLLKHASNVPGCALAVESIFRDAGFPAGLFQAVLIHSDRVGALIDDARIAAVTLTGSTPAGMAVAERAGARVKKCVLELGGSDPYVVLEDADLAQAAEACAKSRLVNGGQSCIAAKRFVVVHAVFDEFVERFLPAMRRPIMGDPLDEATEIGPQARVDLRDALHQQVMESVERGARLLLGGEIPKGRGAFYPPTVLVDVTAGMPAYDEELFGPVAAVIRAMDEAHAIRIANDTSFGLGAAVFTRDVARGRRIAEEELEAGVCFVNDFVKSDPRLPFGGIKESGFGRELGTFGIRELVNVKTVVVG
jgi:succinate-semialdehyde dehydrogenase / glutarate-semialdehyde dehydrogenase